MSTALRIAGLFLAVVTVALWFFGGFNLGRTQWTVPVEHPGEDGRPRVVHEARFLPGSDFLAVGLVLSGVMAVLGAMRRTSPKRSTQPSHSA